MMRREQVRPSYPSEKSDGAKACQNLATSPWVKTDNGQCRHDPPVVFGNTQRERTLWPKVDGLEWCSKFLSLENQYPRK
jgi:hypothetical protein